MNPRARIPVLASLLASAALANTACRRDPPPPPPPAPAIFVPPLHDAQPGEELRLRRGNEEWVWHVASATHEEVEVDFRVMRDGVAVGPPEPMRWPRNGFGLPRGFVVREIRRDRIEVGGRSWECWLVRAQTENSGMWYWVSEEAPVHGVLRMAVDDRGRPVTGSAGEIVPEGSIFPK
jgi:hypothetical protein